ncbi:PadR family transcriptional regulator [Agromyces mediolanus]|uniref:PadR family transcriptional regulator n=1 Tax=Agromyces mediolanus TaxID=41986 RepID=UPI00203DD517|nr:helix-turn-helix transcriptional regulator [Agromyces mediolanus]MCM3659050.1 PadR family transcriptional regulator [Agromyces mediolanus]
MAVREALLTLLGMGPAYGFALHGGLAERTGGRRAVNVGQSYATLERATKAGLIEPAGTTDDGLPLHRLTTSGEAVVAGWLSGTDAAGADPWDESLDRVLIAASLPQVPLAPVVAAERERWLARLAAASDAASDERSDPDASPDARLRRLAAAADATRARAALAWLDEVDEARASVELAFAPSDVRPKRGRRRSAQPSASA